MKAPKRKAKDEVDMKPFAELNFNECRFAVSDATLPGEQLGSVPLFCGEPAMPGRPYCRACAAIAYRPRPIRRAHDAALTKEALVSLKRSVEQV